MWREAISNITRQQYQHIFSEQYTTMMLDSIESTEDLGRAFENVRLSTAYETRTNLEKQLQQVAKLIKVRDARKAERDFFFVQVGGWDMHSNMKNSLASRFAEINQALKGFVSELKAQQIWDSVVLATTSEFARTLDSNGGGSDHAWGGQQFLIGGALKGGAVLNTFPTSLKEGGYNDLGRGRLIPEYPWESMMVPIGEWMGLDAFDQDALNAVFPNLRNFNASFVRGVEAVFKTD
jgi:cullin-associated NEDD8-dissociated protein 1